MSGNEKTFLDWLNNAISETEVTYAQADEIRRKRNINARLFTLKECRNRYRRLVAADPYISDSDMESLEASGKAEILLKGAAEEEFGIGFKNTKPNQLIAKVSDTTYYKHNRYGYRRIPESDLRR